MNKRIKLKNNCIVLFILNICVLLSLIIFKIYFTKLGYVDYLINGMLVFNIVFLIIGIVFNIFLLNKPDLYDDRKSIVVICILFVIYILLNTFGVILMNEPLSSGYKKISDKLFKYCTTYVCDRYETVNEEDIKDFIIRKSYFDYNNVQNDIEIHTKYDMNNILSVEAIIYSENDMFSELLIKEKVQTYYNNFNVILDEKLIKDAFDNRFDKKDTKKDNISYKVSEIYEDGELIKLKTVIKLELRQE